MLCRLVRIRILVEQADKSKVLIEPLGGGAMPHKQAADIAARADGLGDGTIEQRGSDALPAGAGNGVDAHDRWDLLEEADIAAPHDHAPEQGNVILAPAMLLLAPAVARA